MSIRGRVNAQNVQEKEVKKMTTETLLILDCREQKNREAIQKALHKIKPFSQTQGDIPLEMLEKFIQKMTLKYNIEIQWINFVMLKNNIPFWDCSVREAEVTYEWLGTVDARNLYELMCKTCILFYDRIKKGRVGLRQDDD